MDSKIHKYFKYLVNVMIDIVNDITEIFTAKFGIWVHMIW